MPNPHRILYIADSSTGGAAFSLYHLVVSLDKSKYKPVVLFYNVTNPYIVHKLAEAGIPIIILNSTGSELVTSSTALLHSSSPHSRGSVDAKANRDIAKWLATHFGRRTSQIYVFLKALYKFAANDIRNIWPIVRTFREYKIDLVHFNNGSVCGNKAGIVAAWLTRLPSICHIRAFHNLNSFDKFFVRPVASFIYISKAVAQHSVAEGVPQTKGVVIHNALDLGDYLQSHDSRVVRKEFNIKDIHHLVGIIGRLDWWKGHEYFLEAMAIVQRQTPNVYGLIVGEPEGSSQNQAYFKKLQTLKKSLQLEDKIIFTGFRSDVPRLMAALDVVVLSSARPEPFGRVVIEGMAAGKPVVATAAGGVLDIIEDGVNGLLIPCKDALALAQSIIWLLSHRKQARQIGQLARQRVKEKFTVQDHVAAVGRLYENIITQKSHLTGFGEAKKA